jgi:hypothetical protein
MIIFCLNKYQPGLTLSGTPHSIRSYVRISLQSYLHRAARQCEPKGPVGLDFIVDSR